LADVELYVALGSYGAGVFYMASTRRKLNELSN